MDDSTTNANDSQQPNKPKRNYKYTGKNQCKARSSQTGEQCKKSAILGATVCRSHGGAAPQVRAAAAKRIELADITKDRVILELARLAFGDVASFFNADNTIKTPSELSEDQRATLSGFEVNVQNLQPGDNKQDLVHKFKTHDKTKALEILAKYFGMMKENVEHTGELTITWKSDDDTSGN